ASPQCPVCCRALVVHPNTLRYRLNKIEALLDVDLECTDVIVGSAGRSRSASIDSGEIVRISNNLRTDARRLADCVTTCLFERT
ncbi:hypothetical protein GS471_06360, partial [Rhodococcus hoagii]|nr:hypothetical protein [Prescottella equi]